MESTIDHHNKTKSYYVFIFLFYVFLVRDPLERVIPFFGYFDEILALLGILAVFLNLQRRGGVYYYKICKGYWLFLSLSVALGLLGNILYGYQPILKAALPDLFLFLKYWLWMEAGKFLFRSFTIEHYATSIFKHIRFVTLLFCSLVIIDNVAHVFPENVRYGLRSTQLFYFHPTSFAAIIIYLMAILILLREKISKKRFVSYEVLLSILACSSLRSKIIGSVMLMWLIAFFVLKKERKVKIWSMLLFIPPTVLIGWEQIQYYFFSKLIQGSARYQLLTKSFKVANEHFPFGAGFATFASYYSGVFYSPLYYELGISNVQGITETDTSFISDSFWPMVLAQNGYFGILFFALVIFRVYRRIQSVRNISCKLYACGLFLLMYLLVESTSSAAFVHPIYLPIAFVMSYILMNSEKQFVREQNDNGAK